MYRDEILDKVRRLQGSYLPQWKFDEEDFGWAIAENFASILSDLEEQKAGLPYKLFVSYLESLGFTQNPPLAAKVPMTFSLTKNFKGTTVIPKGTLVSTKSKVNFETTEAMMASASKLISFLDYDNRDGNIYISDHSSALLSGEPIEIFPKKLDDAFLYLGDENLFNIHKIQGTAAGLKFSIPQTPKHEIWEYWGKKNKDDRPDWYPLVVFGNSLQKFDYFRTIKREINGIESYWLRVKIDGKKTISSPFLMNFESYSNVDALFHNDKPLDIKGNFYPFGKIPQLNDNFYIASSEAFSKKGFRVYIKFLFLYNANHTTFDYDVLSWEYWNGVSWTTLRLQNDKNDYYFNPPMNMSETLVNGEKNYWIRIRLLDNSAYVSYRCNESTKLLEPKLRVPKITHVNISVQKRAKGVEPQHSYVYSERSYKTLSSVSSIAYKAEEQSLYFGFDRPFGLGLVSLYIKIQEHFFNEELLSWEYSSVDEMWSRLSVKDGSHGFTKSGFLQFVIPHEQMRREAFGLSCYWLKATLPKKVNESKVIDAIYMNTIQARESKSIENRLLGSSDGSGRQTFIIEDTPLFDLTLWILEAQAPKGFEVYPDEFDEGYWVAWHQVKRLDYSGSNERVYTCNSFSGEIAFGDDRRGKIPPMGRDNIIVSYRIGGGKKGNVLAHEINTLADSLAYVDKVSNPINASGGADIQSLESLMEMAPKEIKHRNRAVTEEDYDYLVREFSSDIAKVSIFSSSSKVASLELVIAPFGKQEKPLPSMELMNLVQTEIDKFSPATTTIDVKQPEYIELDLNIEVRLLNLKYATSMEERINTILGQFLHPIEGNHHGEGWEFGVLPELIDFYQLLSAIEGVALITSLEVILPNGNSYSLDKRSNNQHQMLFSKAQLICNGIHQVKLNQGEA